jgi:hypothetical protein
LGRKSRILLQLRMVGEGSATTWGKTRLSLLKIIDFSEFLTKSSMLFNVFWDNLEFLSEFPPVLYQKYNLFSLIFGFGV